MRNHGTPVRLPALLLALTLAGCAGQGAPSPAARSFSATITSTDRPLPYMLASKLTLQTKTGRTKPRSAGTGAICLQIGCPKKGAAAAQGVCRRLVRHNPGRVFRAGAAASLTPDSAGPGRRRP